MNPRILLLGLVALFWGHLLPAQMLDHVQGEILVKLTKGEDPRRWTLDLQRMDGIRTGLRLKQLVSAPLDIWSYTFDHNQVSEQRLLAAVRRHPAAEIAQFDHFIEYRNEPDDPGFPQQWQYFNTGQSGGLEGADIDMEMAWDITTGGLTADGDTIVVCVIDDGLDGGHEDFEGNVWVNHKEIPNNDIDDDGNGYVDDYRGWNTVSDNDNIYLDGGHGTPVAGIVGARGNNGKGVAGINWNVKLMIVYNSGLAESQVLEAYSFPLTHRMRYNETDGEEGAFVVATNASWGIDFGQPADAPLWCAFYDSLGVHGIISCGATINNNVDVDAAGDLPTACPSDYLITVTNMNHFDEKVNFAGYGATTIDLGAFGQGTWTTASGNGYGGFGGTSGATPHVTGTVGLLYSAPCPSLIALAKIDPGAAALLVKQYILEGVDPNASLDSITLTGGRLNVHKSLQLLLANCGPCPPPAALRTENVSDTAAALTWLLTDSINTVDLRWRASADTVWNEVAEAISPLTLDSLTACTEYEFQIKAFCNGDTLDYSPSQRFTTDGCCELPAGFSVLDISENEAQLVWDDLLAAEGFALRIREVETGAWDTLFTNETFLSLTGLTSCTEYEVQIRTDCGELILDFGHTRFFRTSGCGPCLDLDYCEPDNINASEEWIDSISLHTLQWASGPDGGYGAFTDLPELVLEAGATYDLTLVPGYNDFAWSEYFSIWIDLNQDGFFAEDERVFDPGGTVNTALTGTLTVPFNAQTGSTRMRVVMQFEQINSNCNFPPGSFGEVEDYCLQILPLTTCHPPTVLDTVFVAQTLASLEWETFGAATGYLVEYRTESDTSWQSLAVANNSLFLTGLTACTEYELRVRSVCEFGEGEEAAGSLFFRTVCPVTSTRDLPAGVRLEVFPNPFRDELRIGLELPAAYGEARLELVTITGQPVRAAVLERGTGPFTFNTSRLPAGVYLLRFYLEDGLTAVRKVVRIR